MRRVLLPLVLALLLASPAVAQTGGGKAPPPAGGGSYAAIPAPAGAAANDVAVFLGSPLRLSYLTAGAALQVLRVNAGGTALEWAASSATPGGLDTYVQFNDGGVFSGQNSFTYTKAVGALTLTPLADAAVLTARAFTAGVQPIAQFQSATNTALSSIEADGKYKLVADAGLGKVFTSDADGVGSWAAAAGGGITNAAGANVIPKSDGTNLVASSITDNGTLVSTALRINSLTTRSDATDTSTPNRLGYGIGALGKLVSGNHNTAIGHGAFSEAVTINIGNTAVGRWAGKNMVASISANNTYIGYASGQDSTGFENTMVGANSMYYGSGAGSYNTGVGASALSQVTGGYNTAIGHHAGINLGSGSRNVLVGTTANSLQSVDDQVAVGYDALRSTSVGGNVAVGSYALTSNTTQAGQVAVGMRAGRSATGGWNTLIGWEAGYNSGASASTGNALTSGTSNTFVGMRSGLASGTQRSNSSTLGQGAYVNADNTVVLGNASVVEILAGSEAQAAVVAQALQAKDGVGTDIAGANLTIRSGAGTGAGAGSALTFQTPTAGGSGAGAQTQTTRMTVDATRALISLPTLLQREVEANSTGIVGTPNVLVAAESHKVLTNEGATALNVHLLPTAVAGLTFTFVVQDADGIRIAANTDDTIRIAGNVTAAAGPIDSTVIGSSITLVAINDIEWVAVSVIGTWSI